MASKKFKLWFDKELAEMLAQKIKAVTSSFNSNRFIQTIDKGVPDLELKARVEYIADELHKELGEDYPSAIAILLKILGPENEEETGMFTNFYWMMPIAKYVEKYGLEHFDLSMEATFEITKRHTGEYTIRPFIEQYPQKTMSLLTKWSNNENRHVRRLASEGPRPRLPWAPKLQQFIDDPAPLFPILNNLKDDSSKYVQKSVANCLNDILKDNFEVVKSLLETWAADPTPMRKWIIKHALRKLRKQENEWAIGLVNKL